MNTRKLPLALTAVCMLWLLLLTPALAQQPENEAMAILKAMSEYVGSQQTIQLTFDSDIEIITPQLEKIQFTNSGDALLRRPDRLRAHRKSGHADVTMYFEGQTVKIHEKNVNGFAGFDLTGSIDQLIQALREGHGIALPGADLLLTDSFSLLSADVMEAKYIGTGIIDGRECAHLAFRNFDTDWQLWVEEGEYPIPRKMVVTSKTMNSAPQYTVRIKSWKTDVDPRPEDFSFTLPAGATKLDHNALLEFDELPPSAEEGGNQ